MIVRCPTCRKDFRCQDDRLKDRLEVRFKCPQCETIFSVKNPFMAEVAATVTRIPNPFKDLASKQEDSASGPLELPQKRRISLAIIAGDEVGKIFPITQPRMTLGRKEADITIHDLEISRLHAVIEVSSQQILLRDLGSTNGTYVDHKPIQTIELKNQMEFRIGNTVLMLIISEDEATYEM